MNGVCQKCGSGAPRLEPAYGKGAVSYSCGSVFRGDELLFHWGECERREVERLRQERDMHQAGKSAALKACDDYLKQVERLRGTLSGLVNAVKRYNSANALSPGFDHAVARLHEQLSEAERVLESGDE